jgi:hypothetical protein
MKKKVNLTIIGWVGTIEVFNGDDSNSRYTL